MPSSPHQDRPQLPTQQPASSHPSSRAASRRASNNMGPPSAAGTAQVHHNMLRNPVSPWVSGSEHGLPVRHPRPMTAAEMYLECEKEQEAVVRLHCFYPHMRQNVSNMIALGQSPDPGAYCSPCSVCFGCKQHFPFFQLDECFAPPRRHIGSQPYPPDNWTYPPDTLEETSLIVISEREEWACFCERRRHCIRKRRFYHLYSGARG